MFTLLTAKTLYQEAVRRLRYSSLDLDSRRGEFELAINRLYLATIDRLLLDPNAEEVVGVQDFTHSALDLGQYVSHLKNKGLPELIKLTGTVTDHIIEERGVVMSPIISRYLRKLYMVSASGLLLPQNLTSNGQLYFERVSLPRGMVTPEGNSTIFDKELESRILNESRNCPISFIGCIYPFPEGKDSRQFNFGVSGTDHHLEVFMYRLDTSVYPLLNSSKP